MSAKVFSLDAHRGVPKPASTHPTNCTFKSFDDVQAFDLPEPTWVNEDLSECMYSTADARAFSAFFAWFGVEVDLTSSPESLAAGWEYLVGELGGPAAWKVMSPDTFEARCGKWPKVQRDYLSAVMSGDQATARALVWRTPIGMLVRDRMHGPAGSALRNDA